MKLINPFIKPCLGKKRPKLNGRSFIIIATAKQNKIKFYDKVRK